MGTVDNKGRTAKFHPGMILLTPTAEAAFTDVQLLECLHRHLSGDWGDLMPEDYTANEAALRFGGRLLSNYTLEEGRLWIITEADRSATTLLLPEDY